MNFLTMPSEGTVKLNGFDEIEHKFLFRISYSSKTIYIKPISPDTPLPYGNYYIINIAQGRTVTDPLFVNAVIKFNLLNIAFMHIIEINSYVPSDLHISAKKE